MASALRLHTLAFRARKMVPGQYYPKGAVCEALCGWNTVTFTASRAEQYLSCALTRRLFYASVTQNQMLACSRLGPGLQSMLILHSAPRAQVTSQRIQQTSEFTVLTDERAGGAENVPADGFAHSKRTTPQFRATNGWANGRTHKHTDGCFGR